MPETLELDDAPFGGDTAPTDDANAGKVACPECGNYFKSSGIKRHITVSHGDGQRSSSGNEPRKPQKRGISIADTGAKFQKSAALLVSMACKNCASILMMDAEQDWLAIDQFCADRPKLRKQVQDMLSISDFMLLVGALGGTAQKMVAHHSIGKNLPFGLMDFDIPTDHNGHDPKASMAEFLMAIPEEERNQMLNDALRTYANANGAS